MIAGAPSRKLPRDLGRSIQPAFEQLHLPWLCPRLHSRTQSPVRPSLQHRATATVASRRPAPPTRAQSSPVAARQNGQQERTYAYAASNDYRASRTDDFYVPLVSDQSAGCEPWGRGTAAPGFHPLILDDSTILPLTTDRKSPLDLDNGTLTTPAEIHQNLEACLIVGLHERAAATMRRLNKLYNPDNPDLIRAHNFYIGHMIGQYNTSRDESIFKYIQKWYHVDMINQGIQPDAATYTMLVQLMLRDSDTHRVARGVRKYIAAAEAAGLREAVIRELRRVVNQSELRQIYDIVPGFSETYEDGHGRLPLEDETTDSSIQDALEKASEAVSMSWDKGIPHIVATDLKGQSLRALQQSVSVLTSNPITKAEAHDIDYQVLRQKRLEDDAQNAAIERWKSENDLSKQRGAISGALSSKTIGAHMWDWHSKLLTLIREEIEAFPDQGVESNGTWNSVHQAAYAPYLRFIPPERLSALTIVGTLNCFALCRDDQYVSVAKVVSTIGDLIEQECRQEWSKMRRKNTFALNAEAKGENHAIEIEATEAPAPSADTGSSQPRKFRARPQAFSPRLDVPDWSAATRARVGAALLTLLMQGASISPSGTATQASSTAAAQPAFARNQAIFRGKRLGVVRCDPSILKLLRTQPGTGVITKHLPMLIKPRPWKSLNKGAYLNDGVKAVRIHTGSFQAESYLKLAISNGDMNQALTGLDVLGKVPWRVNRQVFDVMLSAWNTGEAFANFPALDPIVDFPEALKADATAEDQITYRRAKRTAENKITGFHSERAYINFQLEVARAFLDEDMYLPHNMDFRGRAYPIPPYLNHMGADHCRGLLMFSKGKKLGERGLEWLKIHLANVYGFDKASLSERRAFAEENLEHVLDSANNPIDGQKWWLKAEDPWQCLATCLELRNALATADPREYVSHLPVHQDGTCNGLQHYAALGGDEAGAKQVNLEPGDRPSDIYTAVADLVRQSIVTDAAEGMKLAKLLKNKITRKVVKQTVMTNVYGVTFQGAKKQVENRLVELYPETFESDVYVRFLAGGYIAKLIFGALSTIFNGAAAIQHWLGDCASKICESLTPEQIDLLAKLSQEKSEAAAGALSPKKTKLKVKVDALTEHAQFKSSVIWTTPLRMPVVQPYRASPSQRIVTNLQHITLSKPTTSDKVLKRKQLQAFPPNFIHSLDATHMLLSALKCDELGMSFAAVHDSFWTHASDVDQMSSVLRDAFIRMHSEDIVGRLHAEFKARYKDNLYMAAVDKKSILGQRILEMRKQRGFKRRMEGAQKITELLEERERQRLLASDDSALREQGENMMTAARLFAEAGEESKLLDATEDALAEVPADESSNETLESELAESAFDGTERLANSEAEIEKVGRQDFTASAISSDANVPTAEAGSPFGKGKKSPVGMSEEAAEMRDELAKRQPAKARSSAADRKITFWLPLTFSDPPVKGSWEVSRLKESKYFFS